LHQKGQIFCKVPTPNQLGTDNTKLCESTRNKLRVIVHDRNRLWAAVHAAHTREEALIALLIATGSRINEILALTVGDFGLDGMIFLPPSKGGFSRILYFPELASRCCSLGFYYQGRLFIYSYRTAYNICKLRLSSCKSLYSAEKRIITHWFRYSYVASVLLAADGDIEACKRSIGHRSIKSTLNYTKGVSHG